MALKAFFPKFDFLLTIKMFLIAIVWVVGLGDDIQKVQYYSSLILINLNIILG